MLLESSLINHGLRKLRCTLPGLLGAGVHVAKHPRSAAQGALLGGAYTSPLCYHNQSVAVLFIIRLKQIVAIIVPFGKACLAQEPLVVIV